MVTDKRIDEGFRADLKGDVKADFDIVNPPFYGRGYADPTGCVFGKIQIINREIDREIGRFSQAANDTRPARITETMHDVLDERMGIDPKPSPGWVNDGRGGPYDPKTIYQQSQYRVDGADQRYRDTLEQNREVLTHSAFDEAERRSAERRGVSLAPHFNNGENSMSNEHDNNQANGLDALLRIYDNSQQHRTELGRWYYDNRNELMAQEKDAGAKNPGAAAGAKQKERVEGGIADHRQQLVDEYTRQFGRDQNVARGQNIERPLQGGASFQPPQPKQTQGDMPRNMADSRELANDLAKYGGELEVKNGQYKHTFGERPADAQNTVQKLEPPRPNRAPVEQGNGFDHDQTRGR